MERDRDQTFERTAPEERARAAAPPPAAKLAEFFGARGNAAMSRWAAGERSLARLVVNLQPGDSATSVSANALTYRDPSMDTRTPDEMVRLDPAPGTQAPAAPVQARDEAGAVTADLSGLDRSTEPLYLVGHGNLVATPDADREDPALHATHAAGKSPQEIVDWVLANGLPQTYAGTLVLIACHAGTGGEQAYGQAVRMRLAAAGYRSVRVQAPTGAVLVEPVQDEAGDVIGAGFNVDDDTAHTQGQRSAYVALMAQLIEEAAPLRARKAALLAEMEKFEADKALTDWDVAKEAAASGLRVTREELVAQRERHGPLADRLAALDAQIEAIRGSMFTPRSRRAPLEADRETVAADVARSEAEIKNLTAAERAFDDEQNRLLAAAPDSWYDRFELLGRIKDIENAGKDMEHRLNAAYGALPESRAYTGREPMASFGPGTDANDPDAWWNAEQEAYHATGGRGDERLPG